MIALPSKNAPAKQPRKLAISAAVGILVFGGLIGLSGVVSELGAVVEFALRPSYTSVFSLVSIYAFLGTIGSGAGLLSAYWLVKRSRLALVGLIPSLWSTGLYLGTPLIDFITGSRGSALLFLIVPSVILGAVFLFPALVILRMWKRKELH